VAQPDYIRTLSRDCELIEESTAIERESSTAQTVADVRDILQRHREFYLGMSMPVRENFNNRVRVLFERLP
jgi:hypothetical protein